MNLSELYQDVSKTESEQSAEGHALDPIQVGQVCSIYNDKILELTGIDIRKKLREVGVGD